MKKRGAPHDFAKSSPNRVRSSSSSEHDNTTVQDSFESFLDSESQLETQDTSLLTFARPLSPFADLLQHGYVALADAVFNYESKRNHPKTSDGLAHWRRVCVPILAALPNGVLRGIVYGDLAETYRQGDPDLVELYGSEHPSSESYETTSIETTTWLHNASMVAPGHYVRYFVAPSTGLPPTIGELNVIVETLQTYLAQSPSNIETGMGIDNAKRHLSEESQIQLGKHIFLCSSKSTRMQVVKRRRVLADFCRILQERLHAVPSEFLEHRDSRALAYVGYALRVLDRLREHGTSDERSSFLMPLLENTAIYLGMPYRWDSFPVSFAVNEEEAALGEMLINGLALGYIESGFGVAGHPAGLNVNSVIQAKTENWDDAIAFRFRYTCYKHNMVKEGERVSKIPAGELLIKKARLETINQLQDDIKSNIPDVLEIRSRLAKVTLSGEDQASETLRRYFDSIQQRSNLLLNRMEEDLQNLEKG